MKTAKQVAGELSTETESLSEELRAAATHFHLFSALRDCLPEFETELGNAPLFWSYTRHAHLQAAVISVCRIYDQHRCSSNFPRFLETIRKNLFVFDRQQFCERNKEHPHNLMLMSNVRRPREEEIASDIESCSERNPLIATLKNWRDNQIAHKNRQIVFRTCTFDEKDPLTYEAIQKLIDQGYRILNFYSTLFQGVEFGSFPQEQLNDYSRVLRALKHASLGARP